MANQSLEHLGRQGIKKPPEDLGVFLISSDWAIRGGDKGFKGFRVAQPKKPNSD